MIKKHIKTVIFTSALTLVPMLAGVILWDKLPDMVPTHFGFNNQPDSYSSKAFAVFGMPLIMLALHLLCIYSTKLDPKKESLSDKVFNLVLYIIPAVSLLICAMIYPVALGKSVQVGLIAILFMGLVFTVTGNYLPKCKQSYTVGIKLPWTLEDSENWSKTHALAGKLWFVGGLATMATAFLQSPVIFFAITAVLVIVPTAYSYLLYKNKRDKAE